MKTFFSIIKYDYLHRTRSYSFLITLCISLAIAYTFVPEPDASYSTIRIADYVGYYNSAWFGYVTAIMTSIFLSLVGFYLVNSAIKTDTVTRIGQITASTRITNFRYLLSKALSNFLLLVTIVVIVFLMSILLFFLYNDGYSFDISQFIIPYLIIPIPAIFCISILAVVFEVVFTKYTVIQNIGFFFLFSYLAFPSLSENSSNMYEFDLFGTQIVMHQMEESVRNLLETGDDKGLTIGYVLGNTGETKNFKFEGVNFPISFIISRILWCVSGCLLLLLLSPIFHRFDIKQLVKKKQLFSSEKQKTTVHEIELSKLKKSTHNYGIYSLVKTELLLFIRKGKRWLWILNCIGFILLAVLPISIAHTIVLPILWFLQVHRLSDISSKEIYHDVQYFAFTSYKPLRRLLLSQLLAGIVIMLILALPLLIKSVFVMDIQSFIHIIVGAIFIVLLAITSGIVTKGKKLFEIVFFMITYGNLNKIPFLDYFGGLQHSSSYVLTLTLLTIIMAGIGVGMRIQQIKNQ
ncbi:hypothetical protein [Aquimarina litoralis]|uniref:hypothetical protein n=1 Tax=Aquimarina litoralis TaxID=584605 RepID=UPI001C55EB95|nr:hypothetical protein [Aquimarina litoralis]MBW1296471.1 hypothetical protein [Aquimarina litoralis]